MERRRNQSRDDYEKVGKGAKLMHCNSTAKSIVMLLPFRSRKPLTFSKPHLERYLFTFSFEIGTDLPSEDTLRSIYLLLVGEGSTDGVTHVKQWIDQNAMVALVSVCLGLLEQSKHSAIGGIFQRVVMGLKQALYYSKLQSVVTNDRIEQQS